MRRKLTLVLTIALVVVCGFAGWTWFRPYEWQPDPGAHFVIHEAWLTRDHSYIWLDLELKPSGGPATATAPLAAPDLSRPIVLVTGAGRILDPADTTLTSETGQGTSGVVLRYWLEPADLDQTLALKINDGTLHVKTTPGSPDLGADGKRFFLSNRW